MSKFKIEETSSILSTNNKQILDLNDSFTQKNKKKEFFYSNYLPVIQSKLQPKKELNSKEFKDQSIQCNLIDFRLNLNIASHVKIASNCVFLPFQIKRFNKYKDYEKNNQQKHKKNDNNFHDLTTLRYREIGVQTYTQARNLSFLVYDIDANKKTQLEKTFEDLVYNYSIQINSFINKKNLTYEFINVLDNLSENTVLYLNSYFSKSNSKWLDCIERLCRLNQEKLKIFDNILEKLIKRYSPTKSRAFLEVKNKPSYFDFNKNDIDSIDLNKLIKIAETKRKGVRFETSEEKRRLILDKFRRAVRIVIINREWIRVLNNEKKEEREKLLLEYDKLENSFEFMNGKKLQILFNKEEFRAKKNLTALINDTYKRILAKDSSTRNHEDIDNLVNLINSIPRLNTFPKHVCNHISKLIKLIVYEKGREIVREGHVSIGFYYIINGSCDVLSMGNDGLLKIDELQSGDTFGDNSFQNGLTPFTVITNQRTEMLSVEPNEIEAYLENLREIEKEYAEEFISKWWPVKYWNWTKENFENFSQKAEFLRYNANEIITDNSLQHIERIYFIYSGKIELIRSMNIDHKLEPNSSCESLNDIANKDEKSIKKFFRVCLLEKYNYFGFESSQNVNMWFRAYNDDVCVIRITKENFLSIHKHTSFLLSQLIQDYKLAIPSLEQVIYLNKQKLKAQKLFEKCKFSERQKFD